MNKHPILKYCTYTNAYYGLNVQQTTGIGYQYQFLPLKYIQHMLTITRNITKNPENFHKQNRKPCSDGKQLLRYS